MSTVRAVEELARLDDAEFVGVLDAAVAARPGLRVVRDDLLAVLLAGLSADTLLVGVESVLGHRGVGTELARQLRIEAEARAAILAHLLLDSEQVGAVLGSAGANRRDAASALRRAGKVIGLDVPGRALYPAFQFDAKRGRARPVVVEVNLLLSAASDPWGVASWWLLPSGRLPEGQSPADLAVGGSDEAVRQLACAVLED